MLKFSDDKPIYLQISDYICNGILNKIWTANSRVPSTRELAVTLEVNPNTVIKSYNHLLDLNIVYNKRGIGYMVCNDAYDKIISDKKSEFLNKELLEFFKSIDLLSFDIDEISKLYNEFKNKK